MAIRHQNFRTNRPNIVLLAHSRPGNLLFPSGAPDGKTAALSYQTISLSFASSSSSFSSSSSSSSLSAPPHLSLERRKIHYHHYSSLGSLCSWAFAFTVFGIDISHQAPRPGSSTPRGIMRKPPTLHFNWLVGWPFVKNNPPRSKGEGEPKLKRDRMGLRVYDMDVNTKWNKKCAKLFKMKRTFYVVSRNITSRLCFFMSISQPSG